MASTCLLFLFYLKVILLFSSLIICRYSLKPNDQILAEAKHKELLVSPLLQHSL